MAVGREGFFSRRPMPQVTLVFYSCFSANLCVHFVSPVILSHVVLLDFNRVGNVGKLSVCTP
jgi:hypothetical protein